MIEIVYCASCFEYLSTCDETTILVYKAYCHHFITTKSPLELNEVEMSLYMFELISFLERKQYILTTDFEADLIKLKPLGYIDNQDNIHRFCICKKAKNGVHNESYLD